MAGADGGYPVAVTVNEPTDPTVKVVAFADVIDGACNTVNVNAWFLAPAVFTAWILIVYTPPDVADGDPAITAVPFGPGVNDTPDGSVHGDKQDNVATGCATLFFVVTSNDCVPAPAMNVAAAKLVNLGALGGAADADPALTMRPAAVPAARSTARTRRRERHLPRPSR
jgi:hypothetical protein